MRSHEERIAETNRRIAAREWTQRIRRNRCIMVATTVACLALLVVAALSMPNITAQSPAANDTGFEMAASMYSESAALGYIIIGLSRCMRDHFVLPTSTDEQRKRAGQRKRGSAWN